MTPESNQTMNFLASAGPYANTVVSGKIADEVMMQTSGTIMSRGILYNIISRKVGPTTYELTLRDTYK